MNGTVADNVTYYVDDCDCCGDSFGISALTLEGTQFLCLNCRKT